MKIRLAELAPRIGAELRGNPDSEVTSVAQLQDAAPGSVTFLANSQYLKHLASTKATAVILAPDIADQAPENALVSSNPYLSYAKAATLLHPIGEFEPGIHPAAVIDPTAHVAKDAWVGPCSVVEAETEICSGVFVGPGCVIGRGCRVGRDSRLVARVTLCADTRVGERVLIHPGAVLGSDGFGLANDDGHWIKVPQLGGVRVGNDVEIGANTTIDCGTIQDTVIADGVKLDNQIQIAHNVEVGENCAIAGCAGIAGSTKVGRNCTLGGGVGLAGHLEIGDNVHFSGQSLVTRSFDKPGYYSGNLPAVPNHEWRKTVARIRRLDDIMQRLKALEKRFGMLRPDSGKG